jgi:hypothetical protein
MYYHCAGLHTPPLNNTHRARCPGLQAKMVEGLVFGDFSWRAGQQQGLCGGHANGQQSAGNVLNRILDAAIAAAGWVLPGSRPPRRA